MRKLARALLTTSSSSAVSIVFSVLTTKVVAVITGPNGVGLLSLLRQARQTTVTIASLNAAPGIARGIAARSASERAPFVANAASVLALGSAAAALLVLVASIAIPLSWIGLEGIPPDTVRWLSLPIGLGVLQVYFNGVFQGYREVGNYSIAQVSIAAVTAALAWPAAGAALKGHPTALVWMMTGSAAAGIAVSWVFLRRHHPEWLPSRLLPLRLRVDASRELLAVSGAAFASSTGETVTVLLTRVLVARSQGIAAAGVFDAAWTLSMTYVMVVLSSFGTYYLPTVTATPAEERPSVIGGMLRLVLTLLVPLVVGVVMLKPLVIRGLYTGEFLGALEVVKWMLIGDFFKVISWVLLIPLLATGRLKSFVLAEFARETVFLAAVWSVSQGRDALERTGQAFALTYAIQLVVLLVVGPSKRAVSNSLLALLLAGVCIILLASTLTWSTAEIRPALTAGMMLISGLFSWIAIGGTGRSWISSKLRGRRS